MRSYAASYSHILITRQSLRDKEQLQQMQQIFLGLQELQIPLLQVLKVNLQVNMSNFWIFAGI